MVLATLPWLVGCQFSGNASALLGCLFITVRGAPLQLNDSLVEVSCAWPAYRKCVFSVVLDVYISLVFDMDVYL